MLQNAKHLERVAPNLVNWSKSFQLNAQSYKSHTKMSPMLYLLIYVPRIVGTRNGIYHTLLSCSGCLSNGI